MESNRKGRIRIAKESDISIIQKIYGVHTSDISNVVSFEEKTPSLEELTLRWKEIRKFQSSFSSI